MGQRFQFPDGIGGPVRAQVHAEHSIGVTGDSLGHWSSFATDNSSFATVQWIVENESIAIVRNNHDYVSVGGLGESNCHSSNHSRPCFATSC